MKEEVFKDDGFPFKEILDEISQSKRFKAYKWICLGFAKYLYETSTKKLQITGYDTLHCKPVTSNMDYIHRFTDLYKRRQYWKFSRLQEWFEKNKTDIYFLTLTTSGKDKNIIEALEVLRSGWECLTNNLRQLRKKHNGLEYIWIFEPHLGKHGEGVNLGYPHMHVILFVNALSKEEIHRLKKLWSEKYNIGSYKRGCYFDETIRNDEKVEVEHLRAYLLKYIIKTINTKDITPAHFVFLSCVWNFYDRKMWTQKKVERDLNGQIRIKSCGGGAFRLWGASRNLTKIMQFKITEYDNDKQFINYTRCDEEYSELLPEISKRALKSYLLEK